MPATLNLPSRVKREIRFHYAAGHSTQNKLAADYGVSRQTVGRLVGCMPRSAVKGEAGYREQRRVYKKTPAGILERHRHQARAFGYAPLTIAPSELGKILAETKVCQLCGASPGSGRDTRWEKLVIDHCHTTGKFRGMLCGICNTMLGNACDSPHLLRKAASYLEGAA